MIILPESSTILSKIFSRIIQERKTLTVEPEIVASWLSLFGIYDEHFYNLYDSYILDPDDHIKILEEKQMLEYIDRCMTFRPRRSIPTRRDYVATVHLILITMNKSFAGGMRQITNYIDRRLKAVYARQHFPVGEIILKPEFFMNVAKTFNSLPRLKSVLLHFIWTTETVFHEFSLALKLLDYTGMMTIKLIFDFINAYHRTFAHSNKIIQEESRTFLQAMEKKKKESGELWRYRRLTHPEDTELNLTSYPNLACAAIYYMKHFGGKHCANYLTSHKATIPNLASLSITEDKRACSKLDRYDNLTENQIAGARCIGLNLEALKEYERMEHLKRQDQDQAGPSTK